MAKRLLRCSALFPDVVNCMQTDNLELKKLVYLYLMNYAKSQPDMAIMAVNTFVKVRGGSLRGGPVVIGVRLALGERGTWSRRARGGKWFWRGCGGVGRWGGRLLRWGGLVGSLGLGGFLGWFGLKGKKAVCPSGCAPGLVAVLRGLGPRWDGSWGSFGAVLVLKLRCAPVFGRR